MTAVIIPIDPIADLSSSVREAMRDGGGMRRAGVPTRPAIKTIQAAVGARFGVTMAQMVSETQAARIVRARHVAMWLSRRASHTLAVIGRAFGDRDHSTVSHAVRCVDRLMADDQELRGIIQHLTAAVDAMPIRDANRPPSDDVFDRMLELTALAPRLPSMMLWIIARLLVDDASPDALLIVSDALQEAANEYEIRGKPEEAAPLRAIGGMLSAEAIGRSGRGAFW